MTRPTGTKAELEARRRRAVDLLELGHGVREVAEVVGVHPGSGSRWNVAYEEEGEEGLAAAPRTNGRKPKLAEEHYPTLEERLS
ncbi:helix-turn-helix domain-containing protein [Halocatena salina]|uniref:Helix-turn-helix domain-containing protein n=1 Tax=Halocatena salina TaxID=2934340 RepID=A0A8U0A6P9_9EURY|nr:helix-turn-helix domain-containing protein [Halocatena salina]UPM44850.1 helix-turn-helix domain-containing protein [Halocatena salina]